MVSRHALPIVLAAAALIFLLPSAAFGAYRDAISNTYSLASLWRLGDSAGSSVAADSAGANPGTYLGGPTLALPGLLTGDANTAVALDGVDDHVDLSPSKFGTPSRVSVEAWVRLDTIKTAPGSMHVLVTDAYEDFGDGFTLYVEGAYPVFAVAKPGVGTAYVGSTAALSAGRTYHLVATYDGSYARLYVDGVRVNSVAYSGGIGYHSSRDLLLGKQRTAWNQESRYLDGSLDEVGLYNGALSLSDVQAHYNAGKGNQPVYGTAVSDKCLPRYGTFGPGSWPPACWKPYASTSPFNRPLPASPKVHVNSANTIARLFDIAAYDRPQDTQARVDGHYGEPTYYPRRNDPLFTVHCTERWGGLKGCEIEGKSVRIPAGAVPENATTEGDAHMTIVDQASGWEYDFWGVSVNKIPSTGGTLNIRWGGREPIGGTGNDSDSVGTGIQGSATASSFANLGGRVRVEELEAGEISHALNIAIPCSNGTAVAPAVNGHGATACGDPTNAPPVGAHFHLDMTNSEIEALAVPAWKKTLMRAMARYGMFVGDTGGDSLFAIEQESGDMYTALGHPDKWLRFAKRNGFLYWPGDSTYSPAYVGKWTNDGIPWNRLRMIDPCVSMRTC
ncbi:MAG: LamG domain-containing protein [Actinomycetota bacterium]|nr:LamG domain-containing protein [Actinomycetota bacterium]